MSRVHRRNRSSLDGMMTGLCLLALSGWSSMTDEVRAAELGQGGETSAISSAEPGWTVEAGHGYSVCEAFVRNLSAFPLAEEEVPRACKIKIHPKFTAFSRPEWEELDIKSNLKIVHASELLLKDWLVPRRYPPSAFEEWVSKYERQVETGEFQPRLRRTRLALNQRGEEILIWYEPETRDCERYPHAARVGAHIFVLRDDPQQPLEQIWGSVGSHSKADVITYRGKSFFLSGSPYGPRRVQLTISVAFPPVVPQPPALTPYVDRYVLESRCEIEFNQ